MISLFQKPERNKIKEPAPDPITFQPFQRYRGRDEINKQALQRPQPEIQPVRPAIASQGPSQGGGVAQPIQRGTGAILPGQPLPAQPQAAPLVTQPGVNDAATEEAMKMAAIKQAIAARNNANPNQYSLINNGFRPIG